MQLFTSLLSWIVWGDPAPEMVRYLRPSGNGFVTECEFSLRNIKTGSSIESVTSRAKARLTVFSQFDERDRLISAHATLVLDGKTQTVTVAASEGKAKVQRADKVAQDFEVPS